MKISKKSKIFISTVAVVTVICLAVVGFFVSKSKKPFPAEGKTDFAMGTVVSVKTFGSKSLGVIDRVINSIKKLDTETLTNKTPSSLIGRVNAGETVAIDESEYKMLSDCLRIYSKTDGRAALSVGALSSLWDFDSANEFVPEKNEIEKAKKRIDDSKIFLEESSLSVGDGVILDLGSVGKGAACDEAAKILEESGVENAVVAVGGSIYAKGNTAKDRKINVGVRNPFGSENEYFGFISTDNAFISTSGNYEKVFEKDGKRYHHLLDCKTGYPVENDLLSVTVKCKNGAKSDALSTACYILGYGEKTLELLKENEAEAIFVFSDKRVVMSKGLFETFTLTDNGFTVSEYEV